MTAAAGGPVVSLDHVVLLTPDLDAAVADYRALLGVGVAWRAQSDDAETAIFTLPGGSLELMAPRVGAPDAAPVRAALAAQGEGLASLCFRVDDAQRMHRRLARLGLSPEDVRDADSVNLIDGASLRWRRTRAAGAATHGVRLFFLAREAERPLSPAQDDAPVTALERVLVATQQPDRAAALYGAKLGLDMRLDLARPDWGLRLMFFRCGDATLEVAHRLAGDGVAAAAAAPDRPAGLSWRVADAGAARARLAAAGFDVSEVRAGRERGTRLVSVRDRTAGVPTILIAHGAS
jgi:catechol 2,3-dioxygenase-like lactoylglutathione lyase family enzyme